MKIILPFKKEIVFKDNVSEITSISLEHQLDLHDCLVKGNFLITGQYLISTGSNTVLPFSLDLPVALSIEDNYDTTKAVCDIDDFYYEIINNKRLAISIDISIDKLKEKEMIEINNPISDIEVLDERNDDLEINNQNRCVEDSDYESEDDDVLEEDDALDILEEITEQAEESKEENIEQNLYNEKINNYNYEDKIEDAIATIRATNKNEGEVHGKINSLFDNLDNTDIYISYNIYILREGDTIDTIQEKYNIDIDTLKEYNDISDLKIGDKIIIPNKCAN